MRKLIETVFVVNFLASEVKRFLVKKAVLGNRWIPESWQKRLLAKVGVRVLSEQELPESVKRKLGLGK